MPDPERPSDGGRDRLFSLRAFLFVPILRERFVASALRAKPPAVILDLEDSIPVAEKARARDAVQSTLATFRREQVPVFVRVNRGDDADLAACRSAKPDGVFLPKVEHPGEAEHAARALATESGRRALLVATIETASGVLEAKAVGASTAVDALMFGVGDFVADAGFALDAASLHVPAALVALAARAHGKPALGLADGALGAIGNPDALAASAAAARNIGYTGAPIIHPAQIAPVERGFAPTDAEKAVARRIVDAFESADGRAARLGNQLVERPTYLRAAAILRSASRSLTSGDAQ